MTDCKVKMHPDWFKLRLGLRPRLRL